MKLLVNSTPIALWHDVVHEAETSCDTMLNEDLESYLVFLLVRYTNKPEIVKTIIATEFLCAYQSLNERQLALQNVGDRCLIFSGLFPRLAEKRLVKISYFIHVGQVSYSSISNSTNDIYDLLAKQFVSLTDVLQSIRDYTDKFRDLLPMQAYDLWNEAGSQRALKALKSYSQALPLKTKRIE